jgi:hypothetical protein
VKDGDDTIAVTAAATVEVGDITLEDITVRTEGVEEGEFDESIGFVPASFTGFDGRVIGGATSSAYLDLPRSVFVEINGPTTVTADTNASVGDITIADIRVENFAEGAQGLNQSTIVAAFSALEASDGDDGEGADGSDGEDVEGGNGESLAEGNSGIGTAGDPALGEAGDDGADDTGNDGADGKPRPAIVGKPVEDVDSTAGFVAFNEQVIDGGVGDGIAAEAIINIGSEESVTFNGDVILAADADARVGDINISGIIVSNYGYGGDGGDAITTARSDDGYGGDGGDGYGGNGGNGGFGEGGGGGDYGFGEGGGGPFEPIIVDSEDLIEIAGGVGGAGTGGAGGNGGNGTGGNGGDGHGVDLKNNVHGGNGGDAVAEFTAFNDEVINGVEAEAHMMIVTHGPVTFNGDVTATSEADGTVGNIAMMEIDVLNTGFAGDGGYGGATAEAGDGYGGNGGYGFGGNGGDSGYAEGGGGGFAEGGALVGIPNGEEPPVVEYDYYDGIGGDGGDGTGGNGGNGGVGRGGDGGDGFGNDSTATATAGHGGDSRATFLGFKGDVVKTVSSLTAVDIEANGDVTFDGPVIATSDANARIGSVNISAVSVLSNAETGGLGGEGTAAATFGIGYGGDGKNGYDGDGGSVSDADNGRDGDDSFEGQPGEGGAGIAGSAGLAGDGYGGNGGDGYGGNAIANGTGGDGGSVETTFLGFGDSLIDGVQSDTYMEIQTVGDIKVQGEVTVASNAMASIANGNGQGGEGDEQDSEAGFGLGVTYSAGLALVDGFDGFGSIIIGSPHPNNNGSDGSGVNGGTGGLGGTGSNGTATKNPQDGADGDANRDFVPFKDSLIDEGARSSANLIVQSTSDNEENGGDIVMVGGIDLDSTATVAVGDLTQNVSEGSQNIAHVSGDAFAEGAVILLAGNDISGDEESIGVGNIDIQGNVTSNATANLSIGENIDNWGNVGALANLRVDAANDVLLTPTPENITTGNLIGAEAVATSSGYTAGASSLTVIQAGERTPPGSEGFFDTETTESKGNASIKGDVYSYATTEAVGEETKERAGAVLDITAHGDSPDGGSVINEYYTHALEAVARTGVEETENFSEAFTDATQTEINAAIAGDTDGSPTTFREYSLGGPSVDDSPTSDEIVLRSDLGIGIAFIGEGNSAGARTMVHFHDQALIFQMSGDAPVEGIDPFIFGLHEGQPNPTADKRFPDTTNFGPDDPTAPGQSPTSLSLTAGSAACTMGEDGIAINSDGQLLFAEFMFQDTALEFGENGCDEVVAFPQVDVQ